MLLALFFTWLIMGLWHGSNWQFAFWGIWHACLIVIFRTFKWTSVDYSGFSFSSLIGNIFTIPLIMLAWIFFRAPSVDYAFSVYSVLFSSDLFRLSLAFRENFYILIFIFYAGMVFCFYFERYWYQKMFKAFKHKVLFLSFLHSFMIFLIWMFWGGERQFIYFQF